MNELRGASPLRPRIARRAGVAGGLAAASALLLTACAAGQHAETVEQSPAIDGVGAQVANISIQAAGILPPADGTAYPKGAAAPLALVIVNTGSADDQLVSVSSPVAAGSTVGDIALPASVSPSDTAVSAAPTASDSGTGGSTGSSLSPSPSLTGSPSTSSTDSASPSVSGSASESGGASASGASSSAAVPGGATATGSPIPGQQSGSIMVPAGQSVNVGYSESGPNAELTGLTSQLYPSQPVSVTFNFKSGTTVTVTLAVKLNSAAPTAPTVTAATEAGGE